MTGPRLELWRTVEAVSVPEAAGALRISVAHAYRLAERGELPSYVDAGGRRRVRTNDLARIVDAQPALDDEGA